MTTQQISKGLRWMRDYGILVLTIAVIALTVAYFRHDYIVTKEVVPKVMSGVEIMDRNNVKIDRNTLLIDSLQRKVYHLETILNTPYYERFPEEHLKLHQNEALIDSLERQTIYLNSLLKLPYDMRFPEVKGKIDSLQRKINYLDSMIRIPFEQRSFGDSIKK
jgi:hypothetical protein